MREEDANAFEAVLVLELGRACWIADRKSSRVVVIAIVSRRLSLNQLTVFEKSLSKLCYKPAESKCYQP